MGNRIQECDLWWFRELYEVLSAFADSPRNTITRIGGGRISIPQDLGNHLHEYRRIILGTYPNAATLQIMKVVAEIDAILDRYSAGGESCDEWFWSNKAFEEHFDWEKIRDLARAFLLR